MKYAEPDMTPVQERKKLAVGDPLRIRLVTFIQSSERRDWTVKELAEELGATANGLYYHLRVLEEAQLVTTTGHKVVDRFAERTYGSVAPEDMLADWDVNRPEELAPYFDSLLELAKADVRAALFDLARDVESGGKEDWWRAGVQKRSWTLSARDAKAFNKRLFALLAEFHERQVPSKGVRLNVTCAYGQH
jgi:DNA-binding transcriptional ArsR family regulator